MNNDILFLILTILVILIVIVIVYFWIKTESKDYVIDKSIQGDYSQAGLNQKCIPGSSGNSNTTLLLPSYYEPQPCGFGLTCVVGNSALEYGNCKAVKGFTCNNIYDCAPSSTELIYCMGGICTGETGGVFGSVCGEAGQTGASFTCITSLGLSCYQNKCIYIDGEPCMYDSQCVGGVCTLINGTGNTGECVSQIQPGQNCVTDYCTQGFGCDFSDGTPGICEPLYKGNSGIVEPRQTGEYGALCSIPLYPNPNNPVLTCNSGLICNFDASTFTSTVYTGLTGYGLCDFPTKTASAVCDSVSGACIPTNVCYAGICQAPRENGNGYQNINYCGYGSTNECGNGYECNNTTYECLPNESNFLCNSIGPCQAGLNCNGYKLGIFALLRQGFTGTTGNFGYWNYIDLPSGETGPSNASSISTYQYMEIVGSAPVTKTKCAYLPFEMPYTESSMYFWYIEITTNTDGTITYTAWTKITLVDDIPPGPFFNVKTVKYTSGGNLSFHIYDGATNTDHAVYVYNYTGIISTTINLSTYNSKNRFNNAFGPEFKDWDVDDVYNVVGGNPSIIGLIVTGNVTNIYYGSITGSSNIITTVYNYTNDSATTTSTWVRYIYNYYTTPSVENFIFNGTEPSEIVYSVIVPNIPNSSYIPINLQEPTCNGAAARFNYNNNIYNMELYYIANRGFRYFNAVYDKASLNFTPPSDIGIQGYVPDFDLNFSATTVSTSDYGNLDRKMYALVSVCE